jgi:hypothetical protein
MLYRQALVAFGMVAVSAIAGSTRLNAQTQASTHAATRSAVVLANARRVVSEDRASIARLEELIHHQRMAVIAEGWTLPSFESWDRLVTPGGAKKALASLEVKFERAKRKLAQDQALVDSLEGSVLSAR